jgi:hypothetical protein
MKNLISTFTLVVFAFSSALLSAQDTYPDKEKLNNQVQEQTKVQTKEQVKEKSADGNGDQVQNQVNYQSKTQTKSQYGTRFIDEDGDGLNDKMNNQDGNGVRKGQDLESSQDGSNNKHIYKHGEINGQNTHKENQTGGGMNGESLGTGGSDTKNNKTSKNKGGKN